MVLLHHRGRKSGREYVTPMMYLLHDTEPDIIYVFATRAGAPANPDWYYNLTAAGDGSVARGTETYKATVRELTGADRDRIYRRASAALPGFASTNAKPPMSAPFPCWNSGGRSPHSRARQHQPRELEGAQRTGGEPGYSR